MITKFIKSFVVSYILLANITLAGEIPIITMATTSSTENSGLLGYLLPVFAKYHRIRIKVIATGTGRALKLGKNGDVDVVMVHAPEAEKQFINQGFGVERNNIMYNHFVIVGPKDDPANIARSNSAKEALSNIARKQVNFISRADKSGTHLKEQSIWHSANIVPKGQWYKEVGQGMGKTLQITDELNAYTLIDQGTWLKLGHKTQLKSLYYGDPLMFNPYSVILINPKKHPDVRYQLAKIFVNWMRLDTTKKLINDYTVNNQQLFFAR